MNTDANGVLAFAPEYSGSSIDRLKEDQDKALACVDTPAKLRSRLMETHYCLTEQYRRFFPVNGLRLDFEQKRLYGLGGYFLQWKIRPYPGEPCGYRNQQTTRGCGSLEWEQHP